MPSKNKRHFIAGIDEAGYSPRLGPLVISAAVFETPGPDTCLWEKLRPMVSKKFSRKDDSLPVNDSKKIFNRARGIASLEKTVLSFCPPVEAAARLNNLLEDLSPADHPPEGPWYDAADTPLPLDTDRAQIMSASERLRDKMRRADVALRRIYTLPIHPCRMNRLLRMTANKSVMLFEESLTLIKRILAEFGGGLLKIAVDKHGGRHYYGPLLSQAFPMARIDALHEGPAESLYYLEAQEGRAHISFRESAESACLPVALASMMSKYIRELFMAAFNRYWLRRLPGLRRTAGYPVDADRFLKDIGPRLEEMNVDMQNLVRSR